MEQEIPGIETLEQATRVEQLLTTDGIEAPYANFIYGRAVYERRGEFFGKKMVVAQMLEGLKDFGIVVVEGGYRSGKTSLLRTVGDRLLSDGVVGAETSTQYLANRFDSFL